MLPTHRPNDPRTKAPDACAPMAQQKLPGGEKEVSTGKKKEKKEVILKPLQKEQKKQKTHAKKTQKKKKKKKKKLDRQ